MNSQQHRVAWPTILAIAAIPMIVHAITAGDYGIFRDEYYYLACARRLAWGYVDHPPLSIAVLAVLRAVFGEGLLALRLVPALCAGAIVTLCGYLAAQLGGGRFAQTLAATAMATVGVMHVTTGFYSMNALDLVFWTAAWLLLARWTAAPSPERMLALGVLLGFGLLNKIGLLVFGAALALALPMTPLRRALRTPEPYLGAAVALLLFLPHVVWQAGHDWPTLEFIQNAQASKIRAMSIPAFLGEVALEHQPATAPVWLGGLLWLLLAERARAYRLLGLVFLCGFALLLLQRAKPYYAAGLFPVLMAAGGCAWESVTRQGRRRLARPVLLAAIAAAGVVFAPMTLPVLPVDAFARWQVTTGLAPAPQEVGHTSELPQHYADRFGWEELAAEVARVAEQLPPEDRERALIFAGNYGEAGALEYWGARYDLPPVLSGHNTYWYWTPEELERGLEVVIVIGGREAALKQVFTTVERVGTLTHPWALQDGTPIWVGRDTRLPWRELRDKTRRFI